MTGEKQFQSVSIKYFFFLLPILNNTKQKCLKQTLQFMNTEQASFPIYKAD